MYSMMNPEKFRPFEEFDQLLDANYSIHSTPDSLFVRSDCNQNLNDFMKCLKDGLNDNHKFESNSDGLRVYSRLANIRESFNLFTKKHNVTKQYDYLYNKSKLWMAPIYIQAQKLRKTYVLHEDGVMKGKAWGDFKDDGEAEVLLLRKLLECRNTAFVDEDKRIRKWELILKQKGVNKLSSGRDILISKYLGYELYGWVPTFINKRIRGIMSSGILEWWNDIISVHLVKLRTRSGRLIESLDEIYNIIPIKVDDRKSRSFFLIFYFVLQLGLLALICCMLECFYV